MTLPSSFFPPFVAMCGRLQCDPVDLLSVAANESGLNPAAYNVGGKAAGLWQMTPVAAPGMGWDPNDTKSFTLLSAEAQLPHWERYFSPHRGQLTSAAAAYLVTFMPALAAHGNDPSFLICGQRGPYAWAYRGNRGFDHNNKGTILVSDLTAAIDRATKAMGATWTGYVAAIEALRATPAQDAPVVSNDNPPVFISPEPPDHDPDAA